MDFDRKQEDANIFCLRLESSVHSKEIVSCSSKLVGSFNKYMANLGLFYPQTKKSLVWFSVVERDASRCSRELHRHIHHPINPINQIGSIEASFSSIILVRMCFLPASGRILLTYNLTLTLEKTFSTGFS